MDRDERMEMALVRLGVLGTLLSFVLTPCWSQGGRDRVHQPDRVMDLAGVEPGMIIGEVGAGSGYFTFHLARRVGKTGRVFANDISRRALNSLRSRCERESITHIEIILGEEEDPKLPAGLDMVFIVNAFHDIARPVPLLNSLASSLKPGAKVVILDRDPERFRSSFGHFLTQDEIREKIEESVFELVQVETFLPQHNIYIIRVGRGADGIRFDDRRSGIP